MRQRPFVALILALALLAPPAPAETAQPAALAGTPVRAELVGAFRWSNPAGWFGGFSALELSDDGLGFTTLSDHGIAVTGGLIREDGRITGTRAWKMHVLRDARGRPLPRFRNDSEGLAMAPGGGFYVSFEGDNTRVSFYATPDAPARDLPIPRDFHGFQRNSSLEALAIDPQGRLYTLPERSGRFDKPFTVYVYDGTRWTAPYRITRSDDFLAVGADFGPDGRFYLLERDFTGIFGFRSRVRRFDLTEGAPQVGETVLETATGTHGNLEGLSVWRDPEGLIRLTMVADNNYKSFLPNEIVEYRLMPLAETPAKG